MDPLDTQEFSCPYCGQLNSLAIDTSGGRFQQFVQDCEVCCRPIKITLRVNAESLDINVAAEND